MLVGGLCYTEYNGAAWDWRPMEVSTPGSGDLWKWRTQTLVAAYQEVKRTVSRREFLIVSERIEVQFIH